MHLGNLLVKSACRVRKKYKHVISCTINPSFIRKFRRQHVCYRMLLSELVLFNNFNMYLISSFNHNILLESATTSISRMIGGDAGLCKRGDKLF